MGRHREDWTTARENIYGGQFTDEIIATRRSATGSLTYYLHDSNYNIVALADDTGAVQERYWYEPYGSVTFADATGAVRSQTNAINTTFLFQGRRLDAETGLYYFRNRFYSAQLGRFIQRDPAGYQDGMSLYAFLNGRPIGLTDPMGLGWWSRIGGALRAAGGLVETAVGVTVAVVTSPTGVGIVGGAAIALHGLDQVQSGIREVATGKSVDSFTSQGLQAAGVPKGAANLVDGAISAATTLGAASSEVALEKTITVAVPQVVANGSTAALALKTATAVVNVAEGAKAAVPVTAAATVMSSVGGSSPGSVEGDEGDGGNNKRYKSQIDRQKSQKDNRRFWRKEARENPGDYSESDLERMQKGKPPIGKDGNPLERHHVLGEPNGKMQTMTRTEHRIGENFRKNHPFLNKD